MNAVKSSNSKRKSARIDVSYDAMLITSDGHEFRVVVKDLSSEGFRVEIDEEVRAGERVFLRTKRDGDIPAQIVWVIGTEAGGIFLAKSRITGNEPLPATSYPNRRKRLTGVSYVSSPKPFQQTGLVPFQSEAACTSRTGGSEQSSRGDVGTSARAVDEPATCRAIHPSWLALAACPPKTGFIGEEVSSMDVPACLICSDGEKLDVTVLDLSNEGFRVKVPEPLLVNERVQIEMGRAGYAKAIIRWVSGFEAGGVFTPPL